MSHCSGYQRRPGAQVDTIFGGDCRHGFIVTAPCINADSPNRPMCCLVDVPKHWQSALDDGGKPRQREASTFKG